MNTHTGLAAHDGYVEHSHEVRPDHRGVTILNTPGAERTTVTILNYVVEFKNAWGIWLTWPDQSTPTPDEPVARAALSRALASRSFRDSSTTYRLVKRLAVITDEVLEES